MVTYLNKRYTDRSILAATNATRDLSACMMKANESPEVLFSKVTAVQLKYHDVAPLSESQLIAQVIAALPTEDYGSVVTNLTLIDNRSTTGTTTFNYTNLQEAVCTHYSVMGGQEKKPKPREKD